MAREEHDREDLLREATALVERCEFTCSGFDEPIVIGFRRDGAGSVFFGADPVLQFNAQCELRRGYRGGKLIKAEQGRLIEMTRERSERETTLVSCPLSPVEQDDFLNVAGERLDQLIAGDWSLVGQVPSDGDVPDRARKWLAKLRRPIPVAAAPNVRRA